MHKSRLEYSYYRVEKEGNTIAFFGSWSEEPIFVIELQPDGSIELDPDFVRRKEKRKGQIAEWDDFLRRADAPRGMLRYYLSRGLPPEHVQADEDRWTYLQEIALGRIRVRRCGPKRRAELKAFLIERGRLVPE